MCVNGRSEESISKMIFNIIIFNCILYTVGGHQPWRSRTQVRSTVKKCLTGYMTDIQSWVHGDGSLTSAVDNRNAIDLSNKVDAVPLLHQQFTSRMSKRRKNPVRYLSMANCGLSEVPMIFTFSDNVTTLAETVEYVTFYGNNFALTSSTGQEYDVLMNATDARELTPSMVTRRILTIWSSGFIGVTFPKLKELDLRSCSIRALESRAFAGMSKLESLFLGENSINVIDATAFHGLKSLIHLDLSRNFAYDNNDLLMALEIESIDIFQDLVNLQSLDFSYTKLTQRNTPALRSLSPKMQRLSLCYCSISRLREDAFRHTSLRYLDVSGNLEVLSHPKSLRGLEGTLRVLYAEDTALKTLEPLKNFRKLEILKLTSNEITGMPKHIVDTLSNLLILDLDKNRIITWFERNISFTPKLALLSLRENNINMISDEMAKDIANVSYVGLSKNFIICNCYARDIYELAWRNEMFMIDRTISRNTNESTDNRTSFHIAFDQYNELVANRKPLLRVCDGKHICDVSLDLGFDGSLKLFDYTPADYQCLLVTEGPKTTGFENFPTCNQMPRDNNLEDIVRISWNRLYLIAIPAIILPSLAVLFVMRRNLWYFFITMRNSAMLSLINKNENIDDGTIFNYDVFVSYCNEDRAWVLDQLLPHVERDCNISVCLHERDFQVGLSILENIVSCMDRSRSIMLVLSQRFLLSQWCQFEMHLAQHRLLETRREDLILILLEDIPRRLRPNTLHYLMLTKTYIVWPKTEGERTHFWKRLKKSLVTHKQKSAENSSLA